MSSMSDPRWGRLAMVKKGDQHVTIHERKVPRFVNNGWYLLGFDRGKTKEEYEASCARMQRILALHRANPERSVMDILIEVDGRERWVREPQGFVTSLELTPEVERLIAAIDASRSK